MFQQNPALWGMMNPGFGQQQQQQNPGTFQGQVTSPQPQDMPGEELNWLEKLFGSSDPTKMGGEQFDRTQQMMQDPSAMMGGGSTDPTKTNREQWDRGMQQFQSGQGLGSNIGSAIWGDGQGYRQPRLVAPWR